MHLFYNLPNAAGSITTPPGGLPRQTRLVTIWQLKNGPSTAKDAAVVDVGEWRCIRESDTRGRLPVASIMSEKAAVVSDRLTDTVGIG
jgi:hypothetical protein